MPDLKRITGAVKLTIDEFEFSIDPNSFTYKDGFPTRAAKGTAGDTYYSENYEDAKGMMKASMPNSKTNDDALRVLRARTSVTTKATEVGGEFSKVMKAGILMNDAENTTGTDGALEVTIEGVPLS